MSVNVESEEYKVCPYCLEKIRKEAIKCRFCGEWLEKPHSISASIEQERKEMPRSHNDGAGGAVQPAQDHEAIMINRLMDQKTLRAESGFNREAPTMAMKAADSLPQSYTFAKIYGVFCCLAVIPAIVAVVAELDIVLFGKALPVSFGRDAALLFMASLYAATGIAILSRRRVALALTYLGAVVGAVGILYRGIIPIDVMLYLPSIVIIPYLRRRRALLRPFSLKQ